jgi:fructokinase
MTRVAVMGEALVDVIGGVPHPGGSPVNVAVGLARLGMDVTMATRIGRDDHGRLIEAHVTGSGVALMAGSVVDERTSAAVVLLDEEGIAHYDFDVVSDLPTVDLAGFDLVHLGSIGAYLEPGASVVGDALDAVDLRTLVSFDPNIRPALIGPRAEAVVQTERLVAASHVVKLSDEDAAWLYPGESLEDVLRRFHALGVRLAIATRGPAGCLALADDILLDVPARPVVVADTVGAGDAFMSGLLAAIARDGGAADVAAGGAPALGWAHVLQVALESAAITVSRRGANPPWSPELPL